jgi:hypothetical protein
MGGADYLEGVSDRDITRYRAMANECHTKAEHARHAPDRETWLKLAAAGGLFSIGGSIPLVAHQVF